MSTHLLPEAAEPQPTPRYSRSFMEAQSVASRRIGFSVTRACPLRCPHCSVDASPELATSTWTREFAFRVAEQMPDLAAIGVRFVDFTGGEPVLASEFVKIVSEAAVNSGMTCGIVTSAYWARAPQNAARLVGEYPFIENWDISTDLYHLPFVPLDSTENAFRALRDRGRSVTMRIAHHEDIGLEEATLIDRVYRFAGRNIGFQPVGPVGRGRNLVTVDTAAAFERDRSPCPSTGLLVQNDGSGAPCCAAISRERRDSPLFIGNAFEDDLCDMIGRWRVHPLIQTLRIWGFESLERWLVEAGFDETQFYRKRTCDQCVAMLADPARASFAADRANRLDHRLELAIALLRDFDEPWMDLKLRQEARLYLSGETSVWND